MTYPSANLPNGEQLPELPMIPPLVPSVPGPEPAIVAPPQPLIHIWTEPVWEHKTIEISLKKRAAEVDESLNDLGAKGWEMCGAATLKSTVRYTFKRLQPVSRARVEDI